MGLLLGASIITLAEVLDLFIYNAVIKLTLKGHVCLMFFCLIILGNINSNIYV